MWKEQWKFKKLLKRLGGLEMKPYQDLLIETMFGVKNGTCPLATGNSVRELGKVIVRGQWVNLEEIKLLGSQEVIECLQRITREMKHQK